jgi:hypothetical protein
LTRHRRERSTRKLLPFEDMRQRLLSESESTELQVHDRSASTTPTLGRLIIRSNLRLPPPLDVDADETPIQIHDIVFSLLPRKLRDGPFVPPLEPHDFTFQDLLLLVVIQSDLLDHSFQFGTLAFLPVLRGLALLL